MCRVARAQSFVSPSWSRPQTTGWGIRIVPSAPNLLPPPRRGATLSDRFLAFILPGFFWVFLGVGGKEILVSQRGQGVHLLRGGRGFQRAASSGLRGNNLLAFLTFLLLSLSWEIMKITSFSHC